MPQDLEFPLYGLMLIVSFVHCTRFSSSLPTSIAQSPELSQHDDRSIDVRGARALLCAYTYIVFQNQKPTNDDDDVSEHEIFNLINRRYLFIHISL